MISRRPSFRHVFADKSITFIVPTRVQFVSKVFFEIVEYGPN